MFSHKREHSLCVAHKRRDLSVSLLQYIGGGGTAIEQRTVIPVWREEMVLWHYFVVARLPDIKPEPLFFMHSDNFLKKFGPPLPNKSHSITNPPDFRVTYLWWQKCYNRIHTFIKLPVKNWNHSIQGSP